MRLEHVNLTVSDLDRSEAFYRDVLGLRVRWRGLTSDGRRAVHIGDDDMYLALFQAEASGTLEPEYEKVGFNHLGFVVRDLDEVRSRLAAQGITPHLEADYDPGVRLYFYDPDGVEVELVTYP